MRWWSVAAVILLAGCTSATAPEDDAPDAPVSLPDPLLDGGLESVLSSWDMGQHVIRGSSTQPGVESGYLVHIRGDIHVPDGPGPYPMAIFMHGRHGTCATPLGERLLQPCPDVEGVDPVSSVRSYTGYRYLGEALASHGFVVLSVDANNVNDRDQDWGDRGEDYGMTARAEVLFTVMDAIEAAATGQTGSIGEENPFVPWSDAFDVSRIGLMGHSRGGEGVVAAANINLDEERGHAIAAVMALAPTDFARWGQTELPFATILPYCDGDVYSLHGARMFHDHVGSPQYQWLHMGANHNYYNTVWTRDDWGSRSLTACNEDADDSIRLTPEQQRLEGQMMMTAFFRAHVDNETGLLPLLRGDAPFPEGDIKVAHDAPGRRAVFPDAHGESTILIDGLEVTECTGTECPAPQTFSIGKQTHMAWNGSAELSFSVFPDETMVLRMAMDAERTDPDALAGVSLVWSRGATELESVPIAALGAYVPPGGDVAKTVLADLRVVVPQDADGAALRFDGQGAVQLGGIHRETG